MWSRYQKLMVGIVCLAVMSFGWEGQAQDLTTRATGCLGSDGDLSHFALGDDPLEECPDGDDQVSFKLDDLSDGAATVPFFVLLRFGEEQIIAENGALELRARCIASGPQDGRIELVVTSTLDGWFATSAGRSTTVPNLADDEVVLFTAAGGLQPGQGRLSGFARERLTGAQLVLAPDGSFLALATGSTALGVGLFERECLAVGTASLIRGDLPAPAAFGQQLERPTGISGGGPISNGFSGAVESDGISVGVGLDDRISSTIDSLGAPGISPGSGISGLGE